MGTARRTIAAAALTALCVVSGAPATGAYAGSPPLGSKGKKFATEILKIYHLTGVPGADKTIEKARKALDGLEAYSWKGMSKLLNDTFLGVRPAEDGQVTLKVKIDDNECKYQVATPGQYNPAKPTPLLVALHGGGAGVGSGSEAMSTMGTHMKPMGCLVAAPTAPGLPNGAWAYPRGYRTTRAIIKEMSEMYHVDHNRIYVGGHSMGGYGGYWHAVWWPDRFAGYTSAAGGISAGAVCDFEILYNTPLYVVHGVLDTKQAFFDYVEMADRMIKLHELKPRNYKFVAIPDAGHGFPGTYHKAACEWMFQFTRDPYPKKVVCTAPRVFNIEADREMQATEKTGRCFWVEILERNGTDFDHAAKVVAEYDPKQNLVTVTTPIIKRVAQNGGNDPNTKIVDMPNAVSRIGICLTDDMLDLDKPVKITCNGTVVHDGPVVRSVDFLLQSILETGDPALAFAARVDFAVPAGGAK